MSLSVIRLGPLLLVTMSLMVSVMTPPMYKNPISHCVLTTHMTWINVVSVHQVIGVQGLLTESALTLLLLE